ncbi:hypothetical protein AVEN_168018-1 [Araneus ventricosus]|uniref:Endonuclease/exonuclease/phosphatase domain-containing protein n=1 Tax=Araneus ventricosus TaxID=182803 RepID=A0A4Y2QRC1_ARAVE|nr:hypothetical protein AVEN_168018-1 [Araneus ventricosus]
MCTFLSWNCRGIRSKLQDLKGLINIFNPVCIGLQETFLSSNIPLKLRGYNSVGKDAAIGSNHSGGVCVLTSNLYPSTPLPLHTPLRGSPSLGEYGCPNPEVPRDLFLSQGVYCLW